MLRHAALQAARSEDCDPAWVAQYVAGHGLGELAKTQRFSYLALPSLAPGAASPDFASAGSAPADVAPADIAGADGRIECVALAEPAGADGSAARWALRALNGRPLIPEGAAEPTAVLCASRGRDAAWRAALEPTRHWASVSPVVLPGHDDRRAPKTRALLQRALAHSGIAAPLAALRFQEQAFLSGVPAASAFAVPERQRSLPRVHIWIEFAEPIAGPIALGSGRHAGLGLLCARPAAD